MNRKADTMTDFFHDSAPDEPLSKTRRKQAMDALQDLGLELADLPLDKLKKLELPDELRDAVREYQRISAHGAKKRQAQYIGRLMRDIDPEPIARQLQVLKGESAEHVAWMHKLERWRERLLADDEMLSPFVAEHPDADVQQLRTLIRNARREQLDNKPPKSFRQLYQTLKELIPEPGLPPRQDEA